MALISGKFELETGFFVDVIEVAVLYKDLTRGLKCASICAALSGFFYVSNGAP